MFVCVEHRSVLCSFTLNVNLGLMVLIGALVCTPVLHSPWQAGRSQQAPSLVMSVCDSNREAQVHLSWNICTMARQC